MSVLPANTALQNAPHSQQAEEGVIGAILTNPDSFSSIASFLEADDFYFIRHTAIWQAMERITERRDPLELLVLATDLKNHGQLEAVGGASYITQLIANTPISTHAEVYGRIVKQAATRRKLLKATDEIRMIAHDETLDIETVLSNAEASLNTATQTAQTARTSTVFDVMKSIQELDEDVWANGGQTGYPTGLSDLDYLLGPNAEPGRLLVIGGRPGMGKTSLMARMLLAQAKADIPVAIFSFEMSPMEIGRRLLAMEARVSTVNMKTGSMGADGLTRYYDKSGELSKLPMQLINAAGMTVEHIRVHIMRLIRHGVKVIYIDYLQIVSTSTGFNRANAHQSIGHITQTLKQIALQFGVFIVVGSQLGRGLEDRQDKRPTLRDLRESGSIEADADIVLFIYRDSVYNEASEDPNGAELIIAKNRDGATGIVSAYYDKAFTIFVDRSPRHLETKAEELSSQGRI